MRWRTASLLLLAALLGSGCRTGEKRAEDDRAVGPDRPSGLASRPRDPGVNPDSPAHWLDKPKPDWMKGSTPAAPSWNSPSSPDFDYRAETNGLLAGYVEDPDGRKLGNVWIAVREVGDTRAKEVGVVSTADGAFTVRGLKSDRNYVLSVNSSDTGRKLFGVVYTKTPNPNVRLALLEGDGGLPASPPTPVGGEPKTAEDSKRPAAPATVPPDDPLKRPPTNSLPDPRFGPLPAPNLDSSTRGRRDLPVPQPLENDGGVYPTGGYDVPPARGQVPDRFDLMTDNGPLPWKPPAANIPAPRTGTPIPSATPSERSESRRSERYALVDHHGRGVNLPQSKLVLLTFVTTVSESCRRAVPALNSVQARYGGRGVEVVGLVCDDEPLRTRVMAADQFRSDLDARFLLATEPGKRSDEWIKRYGVGAIPTAVLLNSDGDVLWQGNPSNASDVIRAIEQVQRSER